MDFVAHNAEVRRAWTAFESKQPYRVPIEFNVSMRYFISDPLVNRDGYTRRDFSKIPRLRSRCT